VRVDETSKKPADQFLQLSADFFNFVAQSKLFQAFLIFSCNIDSLDTQAWRFFIKSASRRLIQRQAKPQTSTPARVFDLPS
jgi:hypothetical protein